MNSDSYGTGRNYGGYTKSEMYTFVHNTVLPNLKRSGLNITACDLVSKSVYNNIVSKTCIAAVTLTGNDSFWLTDISDNTNFFWYAQYTGDTSTDRADHSHGVRPLITVVR